MYLVTCFLIWYHCLIVLFNFKRAWFTINFSDLYHCVLSQRFYFCSIYVGCLLHGVENSVEQDFCLTESEFNLSEILITSKGLRTCLYFECFLCFMEITLVFTVVAKSPFCNTVATDSRGCFLVIIEKYSLVEFFFFLDLNFADQSLSAGLHRPIFYWNPASGL